MIRNGSNPQLEIEKDNRDNNGLEEIAPMERGFESEVKAGVDYSLSKKRKLCDFCKDWGFCRWCLARCTQRQPQMPKMSRSGIGVANAPRLMIPTKFSRGGVGVAKRAPRLMIPTGWTKKMRERGGVGVGVAKAPLLMVPTKKRRGGSGVGMAKAPLLKIPTKKRRERGISGSTRSSRNSCSPRCERLKRVLDVCGREKKPNKETYAKRG